MDKDDNATRTPRGRLVVLASVVAVLAVVATGVLIAARGPGETSASLTPGGPTEPKEVGVYVSEYGIRFDIMATFAQDVTLSQTTLRAGKTDGRAWLWPLDDIDHEGEDLDPLFLPKGIPVLIEGYVRPACDGGNPGTDLAFSVTSRTADGDRLVNTFPARNPEVLAPAVDKWCSQGPTIDVARTKSSPNGDAVIGLQVINPGPHEITVEAPAYADKHVAWTAASTTVPAGQDVTFDIHGTDVGCEAGEKASWEEGRLLVDGDPFVVTSDDAWC